MKPVSFTGEPLKPQVSFGGEREEQALLKRLKSRAFKERLKQDLRLLFDSARKHKGVRVDAYRTKDVIEISKVLLMDNLIRDPPADISRQCAEARDVLKKSVLLEFKAYSSDEPQDMNYQFTLNPGSKEWFPLFKFYCTAKSTYIYQLVTVFAQQFVRLSAGTVKFKVTDYEYLRGKPTDKRFIVYAPINNGVAGVVARVLRSVSPDCFHPVAHMYGVEVCKGVRALLVEGKQHEALNERIMERVMNAYQDMLRMESSGEFSENDLFEMFYDNVKQKLMGLPHFKHAFY